MKSFHYAGSQIAIHWLSAALVIFLLLTGSLVMADLPNTTEKISNITIHMLIGGCVGLLVVVRAILLKILPQPEPMAGQVMIKIGHLALNIVLLLLVLSGVFLSLQSNTFEAVFGNGTLPADFHVFVPRQVHGILSRIAMFLIALHVLAALYHHYILKDDLLSRMTPGKASQ
jgi:cytochrome b561